MSRGYNFGAGPATLPVSILKEAQAELLEWEDQRMSVLETGHRFPRFLQLVDETRQLLRELLNIPEDYHVLFLGGPARMQFGMIPMNFLNATQQGGYFVTGLWSEMAYQEACKLKHAYCVTSSEPGQFTGIPPQSEWQYRDETTYLYYTPNETVNGIRFPAPPKHAGIPLIADMTSCLLSEPINIRDYDLIFAGAQKNIANAGLTLVIVKDSLIGTIVDSALPTMYDYRTHTSTHSLYATLPTFNCYMAHKMLKWVKAQGGVESFYEINREKARRLYECIDAHDLYYCPIERESRSLMNACFYLKKPELEAAFLLKAEERGLLALKGHRHVGGLRASLYNAMPMEGVMALIDFMHEFAKADV